MDSKPPNPPPYGNLLELARKGAGLSLQQAARLAGISKATWIDTARGYRKRGGSWEIVEPRLQTIAHMAHAVSVTPERLASEGNSTGAADILREILRNEPVTSPAEPDPGPEPVPEIFRQLDHAAASLAALLSPEVEAQVRRARMRSPDAAGSEIFPDPAEAAVWDACADAVKIPTVALVRAARRYEEARESGTEYPRNVK